MPNITAESFPLRRRVQVVSRDSSLWAFIPIISNRNICQPFLPPSLTPPTLSPSFSMDSRGSSHYISHFLRVRSHLPAFSLLCSPRFPPSHVPPLPLLPTPTMLLPLPSNRDSISPFVLWSPVPINSFSVPPLPLPTVELSIDLVPPSSPTPQMVLPPPCSFCCRLTLTLFPPSSFFPPS